MESILGTIAINSKEIMSFGVGIVNFSCYLATYRLSFASVGTEIYLA